MGQAKRRGTYEERKESAIADNLKTIQLLKEREDAWWDSLTPEEQQNVVRGRIKRAAKAKMFNDIIRAGQGGPRMSRLPNISLLPGSEALH